MPSHWAVRKSSSPASPQHLRERLNEMPKSSHIYSPSNLRRLIRVPIAPDYDEACNELASHPEEQPEFGNTRKVRTEEVCYGTPKAHKTLRLDFLQGHDEDLEDCNDRVSVDLGVIHRHAAGVRGSASLEVRIGDIDDPYVKVAMLQAGLSRQNSDNSNLRNRLKRAEDEIERIRGNLTTLRTVRTIDGDRGPREASQYEGVAVKPFKLPSRRLVCEGSHGKDTLEVAPTPWKPTVPPSRDALLAVMRSSRNIEKCVDRVCSKRITDYVELSTMSPDCRKAVGRLFDVIAVDLDSLRQGVGRELARLHKRVAEAAGHPPNSCSFSSHRDGAIKTPPSNRSPIVPTLTSRSTATGGGGTPRLSPTFYRLASRSTSAGRSASAEPTWRRVTDSAGELLSPSCSPYPNGRQSIHCRCKEDAR
ncbi:hypothetical protein FOL47_003554 [Perkinsus chesapeaki]|uniref:Uncharacterized protein n=1 Tax=Perkinsus chesapeaki TaxID=330153 RepID=A0A7J6M7T2_PERCH|nr:hypothetical protein FOL47_003554 [Perkinsus chesapeaki]